MAEGGAVVNPNITVYRWHVIRPDGECVTHAPIPSFSRRAAESTMAKIAAEVGTVTVNWHTRDGDRGQFDIITQKGDQR